MRWDIGVGELTASVVSVMDTPSLFAAFFASGVFAGAGACGAAVAVFRFTRATKNSARTMMRATNFQRVIMLAHLFGCGLESYSRAQKTVTRLHQRQVRVRE